MSVLVIDYGMGNLGSVRRSLEECGAEVTVSADPAKMADASHLVLPGVGAFADGMAHLSGHGWVDPISQAVRKGDIPLLGICLGMQLLADRGYEGGETEGLGLVPGEVKLMEPADTSVRIPHVGWNEVHWNRPDPLTEQIADGSDFYFVHSYAFFPAGFEDVIGQTPVGNPVVSVVGNGLARGVQFHPEKSSRVGFQLLRNFLAF